MQSRPRAVLVAVQTPDRSPEDLEASLRELERLCDTMGLETVGRVTQRRPGTGSRNLLGDGKLRELARWTDGPGKVFRGPPKKKRDEEDETDEVEESEERRADRVVVDAELTPSQLRNLQEASGVEVLDRTGVILEIFHRHARSREARLQVELARLAYLAPRLREASGPTQRQSRKGTGETDLELDRRRVRDRMAELRREIEDLEGRRDTHRARRRTERQVALVGYTNAGKSSLMRAMTASDLYVADQLFATLDTTVRALQPEVVPRVLVTDTVGFVRDLPHDLVASFRSTLDAALDASLLLHVVDASDPDFRRQAEVTEQVLDEIGAGALPRLLVLNKCDRVPDEAALREAFPAAVLTSAKDPARVADVHRAIVAFFDGLSTEAELFVPWSRSDAIGQVRAQAEVLEERFEDDGVRYRLRGPDAALDRLRTLLT